MCRRPLLTPFEPPEMTMSPGSGTARLVSVNVGLPRDIGWKGRIVHTGIWKDPVRGRCRVRRLNVDGDGQGDVAGHGGEQRAVFVYQLESYRYWQERLKRDDFVYHSSARTSPSTDCLTMRCASAIAIRSAAPSLRSRNLA